MQAIVSDESDLRVNCTANIENKVFVGLKHIIHVSSIKVYNQYWCRDGFVMTLSPDFTRVPREDPKTPKKKKQLH